MDKMMDDHSEKYIMDFHDSIMEFMFYEQMLEYHEI